MCVDLPVKEARKGGPSGTSIEWPHMPARGQRPSFLVEGTEWTKAQRLEAVCAGEGRGIQEDTGGIQEAGREGPRKLGQGWGLLS